MKFEEHYNWGGWQNCLYLANDEIEIIATSDVGPRIMKCGFLGEKNLLLEFEDEIGKTGGDKFRNYGGSRLWHAPENNPRSYIPDNNKIDYSWNGRDLKLTQPLEKETGMQKEINICLSSSNNKIEMTYRIYNKNLWPIEYALWSLTQMANNGRAIIPHEPFKNWEEDLLPSRPLVLWSYTEMDDPRWTWGKKYIQLRQDPDAKGPTKIGCLNKLSWGAYVLDNYVFIKRYNYYPNAVYPDYMCNMEVYTDKKIFELETLSPLRLVEPGSYSEYKENWYIFKLEVDENEESIDKYLLPLISGTEIPGK